MVCSIKFHDHIHLNCRLQQSDVYTRKMRDVMLKNTLSSHILFVLLFFLGGGVVKKRFLEIKHCFGYIHIMYENYGSVLCHV